MSDINTDRPTGTEVVTTTQRPKSVLNDMADRYGMEPTPFEQTVRAICMPATHTREQFAAFLLVAKEYHLNPLTKEIYAFPAKGGGIVPVVSIDGWVSLVNSHPACDGFSFRWEQDQTGAPISCTCIMYRKDRTHPVEVTEYLVECIRQTEPWKMKHRMLRHKAMIQAARYAFGFSGIYDEDEGEKIAQARDVTPRAAFEYPNPDAPDASTAAKTVDGQDDATTTSEASRGEDGGAGGAFDPEAFLLELEADLSPAKTADEVEDIFDAADVPTVLTDDDLRSRAFAIKKSKLDSLAAASVARGG